MFPTQLVLLIFFCLVQKGTTNEILDFKQICRVQLDSLLMMSREDIWNKKELDEVKEKLGRLFTQRFQIGDAIYDELTDIVWAGHEKMAININRPVEIVKKNLKEHETKIRKADFINFYFPLKSAKGALLKSRIYENKVPIFRVQFLWEMASNIHIRSQSLPNESSSDRNVLSQIQHWLIRHLIGKFEAKLMADEYFQKEKSVFVRMAMRKIFESIIDEEDDEQLFNVGYAFQPFDFKENDMQTEAMVEEMADLIYRNVEKKKLDTETIKKHIEKTIENWQWEENYKKYLVNILEDAYYESEDVEPETKSYHFLQELFSNLSEDYYELHWLSALAGQMSALEKNGGHVDESNEIERMVQLHVMAPVSVSIPITLIESLGIMVDDDGASLWTFAAKGELTTFNYDDHSGQTAMRKVQEMIQKCLWAIIVADYLDLSQTIVQVNNELERRSGFFKYQGLTSSINREEFAKQMELVFGELKKAINKYEKKNRQKVREGHLTQLKKMIFYYSWFQEIKKAVEGVNDGQMYLRNKQKQNMVEWLDGMLGWFEKMPETIREMDEGGENKIVSYGLLKDILPKMFAKIFANVWFKEEETISELFAETKSQKEGLNIDPMHEMAPKKKRNNVKVGEAETSTRESRRRKGGKE